MHALSAVLTTENPWNPGWLNSWWMTTVTRVFALFRQKPVPGPAQLKLPGCHVDGDIARPRKRTCRFYLDHREIRTFLGRGQLAEGQDMDAAFPVFHGCNFPRSHVKELVDGIYDGAVLTAESDFDGSVEELAWLIKGTPHWMGGEATCGYLGCEVPT